MYWIGGGQIYTLALPNSQLDNHSVYNTCTSGKWALSHTVHSSIVGIIWLWISTCIGSEIFSALLYFTIQMHLVLSHIYFLALFLQSYMYIIQIVGQLIEDVCWRHRDVIPPCACRRFNTDQRFESNFTA